MKKIIAVSDSHGNKKALEKLRGYFEECDYIFHLGDHDIDMEPFIEQFGKKIYRVKGNCDFGGEEVVINIDGSKIMLVHGNKYRVKYSLMRLMLAAEEQGVNVVFFGHTHRATVENYNGITLINPGTLSYGSKKTFALVTLDGGTVNVEIKDL